MPLPTTLTTLAVHRYMHSCTPLRACWVWRGRKGAGGQLEASSRYNFTNHEVFVFHSTGLRTGPSKLTY